MRVMNEASKDQSGSLMLLVVPSSTYALQHRVSEKKKKRQFI